MSYQYCSYLLYCEIHLMRFIYLYCTSIFFKYVISLCFFNHHRILLFSQILIQFLCDIFKHKIPCTQINPQPTNFQSPPYRKHWNSEPYRGLDGCGEGYCDSDINCLDSDNIWQYTTVSNQCYWFPLNWTWHLQYCNRWYLLEKRPSSIYYVTC